MKKWRTHSRSKHQEGIQATHVAVNAMIRVRDEGKPCVSCGNVRKLEAGHFRISNHGTTRFYPMNLSGQCATCNRFAGGVTYEYSVGLDRRFGAGWAAFLDKLSQTIEPWETRELDQLDGHIDSFTSRYEVRLYVPASERRSDYLGSSS